MGDLTPTPFLTLARALTLIEGKMGEHVDFYEVDGGCARELVALADVRSFPVAQVYVRGALHATWPINSAALFDVFGADLADLARERGGGAPGAGAPQPPPRGGPGGGAGGGA